MLYLDLKDQIDQPKNYCMVGDEICTDCACDLVI